MKPKEFLSQLNEPQIVTSIAEAERNSSGEIRVYVSHKPRHDIMAAARARFAKLGMTQTRHRNGVLIYFAPLARKFAILGDMAIHEKCGDDFWKEVSAAMSEHLKKGEFTAAIVTAVKRVGAILAQHFPTEPGDKNELPDKVESD